MLCCRTASKQMLPLLCALLIALRSDAIYAVILNATAAPDVVTTAAVTTAQSPTNTTTTNTTTTITTTTNTTTTNTTTTNTTTTNTTTTTTTTSKAAVTTATTKAHKPKRPCAFPFWYRDQWHHECLEYGTNGARWCSLTQNFTRDDEWRECARYDLMRYKCTIPFRYRAELHRQCLPLNLEPLAKPTFWCSLVPNIVDIVWTGLGTDWVFCEAPNATDAAYLKAVGPHLSLEEALAKKAAHAVPAAHLVTTAAPLAAHPTSKNASPAKPEPANSKSVASSDKAAFSAGTAADASGGGAAAVTFGLGIALIVGVLLAAVAVAAGFILHRRHNYKRIEPLLSSEPVAEKSSYGGMQAYHD